MYYILHSNVSLRNYRNAPNCLVIKNRRRPVFIPVDDFVYLSLCDGQTDIEENEIILRYKKYGVIKECKEGEFQLDPWQTMECDNYIFHAAIIELTSVCNYNCKHCFNAVDNNPSRDQFSKEEIINLLDQLASAGVNAITLTGGEPMLHPDFYEIVHEIYKRNMFLEELNTNGYFITKEGLEKLKLIKADPFIKISFDGINHHNWMRGNNEAEERSINAIKLCIENGFEVMAQTNVWKSNLDTLLETAEYLDSIGVSYMRIIRTTNTPRWQENGQVETLNTKEFYDAMLEFVKEYIKKPHKMYIDIWQFVSFSVTKKLYRIKPILHKEGAYKDWYPRCSSCRNMIAIGANGNVYPCLQSSGVYESNKINLGNVKKDRLHDLMNDSDYFKNVSRTVGEFKENNEKCAKCKYFKYCTGGCPGVGLMEYKSLFGEDPWKCYFFENGYYKLIDEIFKGYKSLSPMNID